MPVMLRDFGSLRGRRGEPSNALNRMGGRRSSSSRHLPVATTVPVNLASRRLRGAGGIDPDGFRGCGFFRVRDGKIAHQRGYWDSAQLKVIHPDVHDR